tara:strand:+ start:55748 stop:56446 length:699 start_codon:yes stop_codon:yes gene_type:complete
MKLLEACTISGLFTGSAQARWPGKPASAINKSAVQHPRMLTLTGFEGDQQADLKVHGGPDKAVHHYAAEHYANWQAEGLIPPGTRPAAFGENISTTGLTEHNVCIGDIFRLGEALVQVSQGRQPCWKLNAHTGQDQMAFLFQKTLRTGWYYRVLETGMVACGDDVTLAERPHPQWSVARVTHARLNQQAAKRDANELASLEALAPGWRKAFAMIAERGLKEDTSKRLDAPGS